MIVLHNPAMAWQELTNNTGYNSPASRVSHPSQDILFLLFLYVPMKNICRSAPAKKIQTNKMQAR